MNIDEIINKHRTLTQQLNLALSTMEKKDTVPKLREQLKDLQMHCPHFSNKYNWEPKDEKCPYCGGVLK